MFYIIGVPIILILSVSVGGYMAKKKESLGTGKVYGYLTLTVLTLIFLLILAVFG